MPKPETSTPGSFAIEQYKARIAAFVEGKDPIAVQRESPKALARLIENIPTEKLKQPPAPGRWSIAGILAHMAEAEVASSWRYRQMIENSGATLSSFDQNEWARLGDYDCWEPRNALDMFRLLREANLRLFDKLTPDDWQRFGTHVERGRMTVRDLVSQMAGHDLNHMDQVQKTAEGLKTE
ncbi:MAG: DinB family protein [Acidobacteriaceae bacterium]|nr:DinB family protein [Acidobacteriaceae bacterium]